jgi:hypothetical protein
VVGYRIVDTIEEAALEAIYLFYNWSQQSWVESQGSPGKSQVGRLSRRSASKCYQIHERSTSLPTSTMSQYGSVDQYRAGSL